MAALVEVFQAVVLTVNGVPFEAGGSLRVPVKGVAAEVDDGANPIRRVVKVPAGEKVNLWEWAQTSGFAYLCVRPVGGKGFVQLAVRYSRATTPAIDADLTPLGTNPKWNELSKSCVGTFDLDSERAYLDTATVANNSGDTDGSPSIWESGTRELGVSDIVRAWNAGDDDVLLEVLVVPK